MCLDCINVLTIFIFGVGRSHSAIRLLDIKLLMPNTTNNHLTMQGFIQITFGLNFFTLWALLIGITLSEGRAKQLNTVCLIEFQNKQIILRSTILLEC